MSLMAGFDFVTEISNETILKLLKVNLQIGGVSVNPPFELSLPVSSGGISGTAHLIINDMVVDLNEDDTITLNLSFDRASVIINSPFSVVVCPLDGQVMITSTVELVNAGGNNKQVSFNMATATVAIDWSSASDATIASDLTGTSVSPAMFGTFATLAFTSFVHSIAAPPIPLTFSVVPGTNGSLSPSLQFEKLEVHCIPNVNRNQQALGIFGIFLVANHSHGNHHQKTSTAITAAHDGVCISISPGAFHSLVFCPAIADALGTDPAHLPGTCGSASGFETQGVTVNSIYDSFTNGHIDINGSVSKSGFCYDASGSFHGTVTLTVSGTNVQPTLNMDDPDINVDIPWYCWLVAGVVLGPLGLVITGIVYAVVNNVADSIAGNSLQSALGSGLPGIGIGGLSGASFSSVSITTEGLILQGSVPVAVGHPYITPMLDLNGSVITNNSNVLSSGVFHAQVWCMPEAKDYPYTEYAQQQRGTYNLSGTMVCLPFTPHFSLKAGASVIPLADSSGTIAIPDVSTHYPMPLVTGGTAIQQTVHVGYTISGTTIQLTNVPSEGNYSFVLLASATDCDGNPLQNDALQNLSASINVQFEGDYADIGGGFADDVQYCAQLISQWMQRIGHQYRPYQRVPKWQQVNYPVPDDMIQYIRDIVSLDMKEADQILVMSKIAHGNSFYRALFSPAAKQPGLMASKTKLQ